MTNISGKVFISYAHPDLGVVKKVVEFLGSAQIPMWFDKNDLLAGQKWEDVVVSEIRTCAVFLVHLSTRSIDRRGFFHKELKTALDFALTIPPSQMYMMPVKLDECRIPDELAQYHVLDLYTENGPEILLRSISHALKKQFTAPIRTTTGLREVLASAIQAAEQIGMRNHFEMKETKLKNRLPSNLSNAARSLLSAIIADTRSATKGVSFMLFSNTQGICIPYLWDSHVHNSPQEPIVEIATLRMAAEELARHEILQSIPLTGALKQYALSPMFMEGLT